MRGDVTKLLEVFIAGSILRQFELECRWEHSIQWIHRRSYPGVGCWSCLRDASKVLIISRHLKIRKCLACRGERERCILFSKPWKFKIQNLLITWDLFDVLFELFVSECCCTGSMVLPFPGRNDNSEMKWLSNILKNDFLNSGYECR